MNFLLFIFSANIHCKIFLSFPVVVVTRLDIFSCIALYNYNDLCQMNFNRYFRLLRFICIFEIYSTAEFRLVKQYLHGSPGNYNVVLNDNNVNVMLVQMSE